MLLHAVQSMRIKEIKLSAVNVERKVIHMKDVPDIYLMPIEIVLLIEYMQMRKEFPNNESNTHLFIKEHEAIIFQTIQFQKHL